MTFYESLVVHVDYHVEMKHILVIYWSHGLWLESNLLEGPATRGAGRQLQQARESDTVAQAT
jgi:hypothetical protein